MSPTSGKGMASTAKQEEGDDTTTQESQQQKSNTEINKNGDKTKAIIKGKSDWRNYESEVLPNGMQCVFVQDKESKTTATSVCVDAGASSDPRERSGLAHFCEHMCFLGSEKYPGENEFKRYLSMHGGRSNASTSMQITTYHFDVLSKHAEKAVDMFSTFFACPLFTESGTGREVNAVDSENSKNLTNDNRRRLQIYKDLADSEHNYSKFSTGNQNTLLTEGSSDEDKSRMREELLAFHMRHYRPQNMVVVIVGPQELDTLRGWIVTRFTDVIDRWDELNAKGQPLTDVQRRIDTVANDAPDTTQQSVKEFSPAFRPDLQQNKWPVLLTVLPLKERRKVYLSFPLPPIYHQPDTSPMTLISHLLGHEGKGSSFAALQNAGYISSLSSGYRINAPDQCMFTVDISLTEDGERHWKDVVTTIFEYCRLIHTEALDAQQQLNNTTSTTFQRIWQEVADLSQIQFHYTSPGVPYHFASNLASRVTSYKNITQSLSIGSMLHENADTLPLDAVVDYSSRLIPTNCIIERCSKQAWEDAINTSSNLNHDTLFGLKKEKWYDIEYYLSSIDSKDVMTWTQGTNSKNILHLPVLNRYIPKHLQLCYELPIEAQMPRIEYTMKPPKIIKNHSYGRLWHKLDDRYALPKSYVKLLFRNPIVDHSLNTNNITTSWTYDLTNNIHSSFLISMFTDALSQETYDADLSGLNWSLNKSSYGLTLDCGGYSELLSVFAYDVINKLFNNHEEFLQDSFLVSSKDRFIRATRSFLTSGRADSHAAYYMDLLLSSEESGDMEEILRIVDGVTLESLRRHYELMMEYNTNQDDNLECLYQGNVSNYEACDFFDKVCCLLTETQKSKYGSSTRESVQSSWIPGPSERQLMPGKDVEFHFSSENPSEENGAVIMAFQSSLPGYRGETESTNTNTSHTTESLYRTASLRLLCHMLREPFFDELRTKQQLGYVVNSSYHTSFSTVRDTNELQEKDVGSKTPYKVIATEYIYMTILSRKALPCEIGKRIDDFLIDFQNVLHTMPESEIQAHANSLCTKMLKPIQKLNNEVNFHFGKIRRFAPEVFSSSLNKQQQQQSENSIPWNTIQDIAGAVSTLTRKDLLCAWDAVVSGNYRSRLVSNVYGKDFPLVQNEVARATSGSSKYTKAVVTNIRGILQSRSELGIMSTKNDSRRRYFSSAYIRYMPNFLMDRLQKNKVTTAAAVVLGVGLGVSYLYCNANHSRDGTRQRGKTKL